MSKYTLHIYESDTGGQLLNVPASYCESLSLAWDMHGSADLTASLAVPRRTAYALYDRPATPRVTVAYCGSPIWAGRLEKPKITTGRLDIIAGGYWRAIDDRPYTALWSTQSLDQFYILDSSISSTYVPDMYNMSQDAGLLFSLKKNAVYPSGSAIAAFYITTPAGMSRTTIKRYLGTYSAKLPVGWTLDVQGQTAASDTTPFGPSIPSATIHAGTGLVVSSTFDVSPAGTVNTLLFRLYNNSGAPYTNTTEDGNFYVRITSVRVQGTASAQVRLSDIAADVAANLPDQIAGTASIWSTSFDQYEALYEDQRMADTLADMADKEQYQIGINLQRRMFLWPIGTFAQDWSIEAEDLAIERDLNQVYNANYATYQNTAGRILRTTRTTNAAAVLRWGITRQGVLETDMQNSTAAATLAAAELAESINPQPRTRIPVSRVMTKQGQTAPWHAIRPGDNVTIRSLPATVATADRVRTFQPARVQLDLERGSAPALSLETSTPLPAIDLILAQVAGGRIFI